MLTIETHTSHKIAELPDKWSELSPDHFAMVSGLMKKLSEGQTDIESFRIELALKLLNFVSKGWPISPEEESRITENIYRVSEKLTFPLKKVKDNTYDLNLNLGRNLYPVIKTKGLTLYGPTFSIDEKGILDTDMRAEEFCDAYGYSTAGAIDEMICALYRPSRDKYFDHDNLKNLEAVRALAPEVKQAIVYFFQYVLEYFHDSEFYGIIFQNDSKQRADKLHFGMNATIYNLSKAGHGSNEEVGRMVVTKFFDLMAKNIIDMVNELSGMKMEAAEIVEKTGIPLNVIMKII